MKFYVTKIMCVSALALITLIAGCSNKTPEVTGEWGGVAYFGQESSDMLLTFKDDGNFTVYPEEDGFGGKWEIIDSKTIELTVEDAEMPVLEFSYRIDSNTFKLNSKDPEFDLRFDLRKMNGQELLDLKQSLKAQSLSRKAMNTAATVAVSLMQYRAQGGDTENAGMKDEFFFVGKDQSGEDILIEMPEGMICEIEGNMVVAKTTDGTSLESVQWKE